MFHNMQKPPRFAGFHFAPIAMLAQVKMKAKRVSRFFFDILCLFMTGAMISCAVYTPTVTKQPPPNSDQTTYVHQGTFDYSPTKDYQRRLDRELPLYPRDFPARNHGLMNNDIIDIFEWALAGGTAGFLLSSVVPEDLAVPITFIYGPAVGVVVGGTYRYVEARKSLPPRNPILQGHLVFLHNTLRAGKDTPISVQITNEKHVYEKSAKNVLLNISISGTAARYVALSQPEKIGKLKPGESKTLSIPIKVSPEATPGEITLTLTGSDKAGKTFSDTLTASIEMIPPTLAISPIQIADLKGSITQGELGSNDKGSLSLTVANSGVGFSHGLKVRATSNNPDVTVPKVINVGQLRPGESKSIEVPISTTRNAKSGSVQFTIEAIDEYDFKATAQTPVIPVAQGKPKLAISPPKFAESTRYFDNNALDAGERGELKFTVENSGLGTAFEVGLDVTVDHPNVSVDFRSLQDFGSLQQELGTLYVGEPKEVTIPIRTGFDAKDGPATFRITARDRLLNGDVKDVRLNVVGLRKPQLDFVTVQLDDTPGGARMGDGNGIPSNEETVEIAAIIRNSGVGDALGVTLELAAINEGLEVQVKKVELGTIRPNQNVEGRLRFRVPRTYKADALEYQLGVADLRGPSVAVNTVTKSVGMLQNVPLLAVNLKTQETLINNETPIHFTANVKNIGELAANGVKLTLSSPLLVGEGPGEGLTISPSSVTIGTLGVGKDFDQSFNVTLPRRFNREVLEITAIASQATFSGKTIAQSFPVSLHAPKLDIVVSDDKNGRVKLGDRLRMSARVANNGNLNALDTVVTASTTHPSVRIVPSRQPLATIAQGQTSPQVDFDIEVERLGTAGELPMTLTVSEKDFGDTGKTIHYQILAAAPDLKLTAAIKEGPGQNGNGGIEQNERAILTVVINNTGDMPAKGVKVSATTQVRGVSIEQPTRNVGPIATGDSKTLVFTVDIPLVDIPIGQQSIPFPIQIVVEQDGFESRQQTLRSQVYQAGVEQVTIDRDKGKREEPYQPTLNRPPTIKVDGIVDGQTFYSSPIQFSGAASDDRELNRVYVQQESNGPTVYDSGLIAETLLNFQTRPISLREGANTLFVTAIDNLKEMTRLELHVTYQKPRGTIAQLDNLSDVDVNIPQGVKNTNAVALVIGIEKYQNVPKADYADRDAIAFQQYLVTLLGVDESNVIPLINERATLAGINTGLRRLENMITPGQSDVFVFYSGHGVPTIDGTQKFLIPHDGDPNFPQDSGYPLMRLYERLSNLNASSVTVFVDACFSGTDKNNTLIIASAKPVLKVIEGPEAYPNLEIFSSYSGAQISSSYDDKRHGLFTYYLLEGMRGDADRNTDGKITLEELEVYIKANVSTQARRIMGREQEPMLTGQKERVLVQFK